MAKEIKVAIDNIGVPTGEGIPQVRILLLDGGKVIDMRVVQIKPPYDKLEIVKVD